MKNQDTGIYFQYESKDWAFDDKSFETQLELLIIHDNSSEISFLLSVAKITFSVMTISTLFSEIGLVSLSAQM